MRLGFQRQPSFADLEFHAQGIVLEPLLQGSWIQSSEGVGAFPGIAKGVPRRLPARAPNMEAAAERDETVGHDQRLADVRRQTQK